MKQCNTLILALMTLTLLTSCGQASTSDSSTQLLLAGAASLEQVYEEALIPLFESQQENITVIGTYDSSGKLQLQLEQGLEADLFHSAATLQMDKLVSGGFVAEEEVVNLLENQLTLIVPADSSLGIQNFSDLLLADTIAIGDPDSVPAGMYGKEVLDSLGLWEAIYPKASLAANVTEVLSQVATGSADAGIVYATDAASLPEQVTVVAIAPEDSLSQPVVYPIATLVNSKYPEEAQLFLAFLQSDQATDIFEAYGFLVVAR